jgi:hypothetical protein
LDISGEVLGGIGRQGIRNGRGVLRDFEEGVTGVRVGHVASERIFMWAHRFIYCHITRFRMKGHTRDMMKAFSYELRDLVRSA